MRFLFQLLFFLALGALLKQLARSMLGHSKASRKARVSGPVRAPRKRNPAMAVEADYEVIEDE